MTEGPCAGQRHSPLRPAAAASSAWPPRDPAPARGCPRPVGAWVTGADLHFVWSAVPREGPLWTASPAEEGVAPSSASPGSRRKSAVTLPASPWGPGRAMLRTRHASVGADRGPRSRQQTRWLPLGGPLGGPCGRRAGPGPGHRARGAAGPEAALPGPWTPGGLVKQTQGSPAPWPRLHVSLVLPAGGRRRRRLPPLQSLVHADRGLKRALSSVGVSV